MKAIIFSHNKQLSVLSVTQALPLEEIIKNDIPTNTPYKIVETLNVDNDFFNAYEFDQELGAKINIPKAKEIQKNKFRAARKPILEKLDVEYMRADEQGDTALKQQIAAQKQELRDVTNTPLPDDLEGIKNTWPSILDL